MNNPTSTSGSGRCSAYFDAIRQAEDDVADALGHIRAEEDAGRITTVEAATERVGLLERHLERCRQLPPSTSAAPDERHAAPGSLHRRPFTRDQDGGTPYVTRRV